MMEKHAPPRLLSPYDRVVRSAEALDATLRLALALARSQRTIDLSGLERELGRLCAASLDLTPAEGRAMRSRLATLVADLDALSACLAGRAGDNA